MAERRAHAVVIGGSLAGLSAASVLAGHFDQVTLVERDRFPDAPAYRKGVPQSRHLHILVLGGQRAFTHLFPGIDAELLDAGAVPVHVPEEMAWLNAQGWSARFVSSYSFLSCSRELLDWHIRARLATLGNLQIVDGHEVTELIPDGVGVAGVRLRAREQAAEAARDLAADLVVDASGRGSMAPKWLETLGCPRPAHTRIDACLGYATRVYAPAAGFSADWLALYIQGQPPAICRAGALCPIEGGRWMVTLSGVGGDHPPTDERGFLAFARGLRSPLIFDAIRDAEPLSPIWGYHRTANERWGYEDMRRWPERFVVVGDAACVFNPVYGHGMSVAAMTAVALDRRLSRAGGDLSGFSRGFQREVAECSAAAWLISTSEDLRFPTTTGSRVDARTRLMHGYFDRVLRAANRDAHTNRAILEVLGLIAPPESLFRPGVLIRALAWGGRCRADASGDLAAPRPLSSDMPV